MSCVNVVAADTDAEAERLATSVKQFFMGVVTGKRQLLPPPVTSMDSIWNVFEEEAVMQMLAYSFIGGPEKIKAELSSFIEQTGVDEVMATSHIFEHSSRLYSYKLFAEVFKKN
jgi:alkanesulfonate monooxygenase SsuD/methylene tetrahydromethanopterin reductase-like flavin-dependent oxidoreductase (luciferase family)